MADNLRAHVHSEDDKKGHQIPQEAIVEAGIVESIAIEKDELSSQDGDDALKLAGAHAHQFDEKYYSRLRRKIVGTLSMPRKGVDHESDMISRISMSCRFWFSSILHNSWIRTSFPMHPSWIFRSREYGITMLHKPFVSPLPLDLNP